MKKLALVFSILIFNVNPIFMGSPKQEIKQLEDIATLLEEIETSQTLLKELIQEIKPEENQQENRANTTITANTIKPASGTTTTFTQGVSINKNLVVSGTTSLKGLSDTGVVQANGSGKLSASSGSTGQLLMGGSVPEWGNLTSKDASISITNDSGNINLSINHPSSKIYKNDIADMGDASNDLTKLRPVTFSYKKDESQIKQYGLIAEEVAQVYPELVVFSENNEPKSVRYHELAPMLLNEYQSQQQRLNEITAQNKVMLKHIEELNQRLNSLESKN